LAAAISVSRWAVHIVRAAAPLPQALCRSLRLRRDLRLRLLACVFSRDAAYSPYCDAFRSASFMLSSCCACSLRWAAPSRKVCCQVARELLSCWRQPRGNSVRRASAASAWAVRECHPLHAEIFQLLSSFILDFSRSCGNFCSTVQTTAALRDTACEAASASRQDLLLASATTSNLPRIWSDASVALAGEGNP